MVRHSTSASELWSRLPWRKFKRDLFRLQMRIFKAVRNGELVKARKLQKLILKSRAAKLLAIRQITQLNKGKKTAGVDGIKSVDFLGRFQILFLLNDIQKWEPGKLRRIPVPKKNGKIRILSVPTIFDRIWQCLVKFALEPAYEATFSATSYGFRTGRSQHDAQKVIFQKLKGTTTKTNLKKRIIELDIKKCFDRISHESIMHELIAPVGMKTGIWRSLKAGVFPDFPEQGCPQGGVFSPLLANIALNGIEDIHNSVRYADDMVIILKPNDNEKEILNKIKEFLSARGMEISEEKTKITPVTDGFTFLGWLFKVQKNGKFRCVPSAENYKEFSRKCKNVINNSCMSLADKEKTLKPIVRGWRNYHRFCQMSGSRFSLWFLQKRFHYTLKKTTLSRQEKVDVAKRTFPVVGYKENAFVNVKTTASPYDGDLTYWVGRNSKNYSGKTVELLKSQNNTCPICGGLLLHDEDVQLHHLDGNHDNWSYVNLSVMHRSCHQYIHMTQKSTD